MNEWFEVCTYRKNVEKTRTYFLRVCFHTLLSMLLPATIHKAPSCAKTLAALRGRQGVLANERVSSVLEDWNSVSCGCSPSKRRTAARRKSCCCKCKQGPVSKSPAPSQAAARSGRGPIDTAEFAIFGERHGVRRIKIQGDDSGRAAGVLCFTIHVEVKSVILGFCRR